MTRAQLGLVIWVPPGDSDDPTRAASFYDPMAEYLQRCGVMSID